MPSSIRSAAIVARRTSCPATSRCSPVKSPSPARSATSGSSSTSASPRCSTGAPRGTRNPVRYQLDGCFQPGNRSSDSAWPPRTDEIEPECANDPLAYFGGFRQTNHVILGMPGIRGTARTQAPSSIGSCKRPFQTRSAPWLVLGTEPYRAETATGTPSRVRISS